MSGRHVIVKAWAFVSIQLGSYRPWSGKTEKIPKWFRRLSRGNEHWAVNACKYWQGWPRGRERATAHLDISRSGGMTDLPPHCLPADSPRMCFNQVKIGALSVKPYGSRGEREKNLDSTWTLPVALKHIHLSLCQSAHTHAQKHTYLNMIYQQWKPTCIIVRWAIIPAVTVKDT